MNNYIGNIKIRIESKSFRMYTLLNVYYCLTKTIEKKEDSFFHKLGFKFD
jgi:hypothetical protein